MKRLALLAAIWLLLAPAYGARADVTIYRDRYGVPSIVAGSVPEAAYGLGYAMAHDGAERMALNFKQARGRMAEVEGRKQLLADTFLRALGIEAVAEEKSKHLSGEFGEAIRRFCDGANRALAEQKGKLPDWVEPFTPVDVLAMAQLTNAAFPLQDLARQLLPGFGSNQFAIAPKRTATGHAILSIDPHLTWDGLMAWYEFGLYTPDLKFRGITLYGLPFGVMGHSDRVAWSMTNNDPDLFDLYTVQTDPAHPNEYNFHGEWRPFQDEQVTLRYREGGALKTQTTRVRRTAWGPMVPFTNRAVRLSMLGSWELLDQSLAMARARDARQFREALRPLGFSMWNIVYADTQGHIGYQFNARVPHRDTAFDWTKPVPGADPRTKWGPLWTLDELPHIEDPKSGLLVNCNSAPWLTPTDDEMPVGAWPRYVTTYDHTTRYNRLASLLKHDARVSIQKAKAYATDTLVPYAKETVAELGRTKHPDDADVRAALAALAAWDDRADVEAKGCALYDEWLRADPAMPRLAEKAGRGEHWTEDEGAAAIAALKQAILARQARKQPLDSPWGDAHNTTHGAVTTPTSGFGSIGGVDMAAVVPNSGPYQDGQIRCDMGSSFRMIVDLDPKGIRSWSILPYGDSQNAASPHYTDQMALFGRGEYKAVAFGPDAARRAAVSTVTLKP